MLPPSNHYGHHPRIIHTSCRLTRNPASTLGAPRKDTGNVRLLTVVMILMGFLVSGTIHTYRRIARASAVVMILMGFLDSGTIHTYRRSARTSASTPGNHHLAYLCPTVRITFTGHSCLILHILLDMHRCVWILDSSKHPIASTPSTWITVWMLIMRTISLKGARSSPPGIGIVANSPSRLVIAPWMLLLLVAGNTMDTNGATILSRLQ